MRPEPWMELWGTPASSGYSCEDFPSRATWSSLLLRNDKIRPNIYPEIQLDLSLWRRLACQTLRKALDILRAIARVDPDLLEALSTVGTPAVYWQDLKQDFFENKFPLDISNCSFRFYESMQQIKCGKLTIWQNLPTISIYYGTQFVIFYPTLMTLPFYGSNDKKLPWNAISLNNKITYIYNI